jgi:hypothetical protein
VGSKTQLRKMHQKRHKRGPEKGEEHNLSGRMHIVGTLKMKKNEIGAEGFSTS